MRRKSRERRGIFFAVSPWASDGRSPSNRRAMPPRETAVPRDQRGRPRFPGCSLSEDVGRLPDDEEGARHRGMLCTFDEEHPQKAPTECFNRARRLLFLR